VSNLIRINAIILNPANPFTWASGWKSPIYCDNRKILSYPNVRRMVTVGFKDIINEHFSGVEVVAGVATGAIAHGALVANELNLPFVYVRPEPKKHGLANQIEGDILPGQKVVVVEDLISTGKSSLNAVNTLREAGVEVLGMVAIFTYGFEVAQVNFKNENVKLVTLGSYSKMIELATKAGTVSPQHVELLHNWRMSPETWGQ